MYSNYNWQPSIAETRLVGEVPQSIFNFATFISRSSLVRHQTCTNPSTHIQRFQTQSPNLFIRTSNVVRGVGIEFRENTKIKQKMISPESGSSHWLKNIKQLQTRLIDPKTYDLKTSAKTERSMSSSHHKKMSQQPTSWTPTPLKQELGVLLQFTDQYHLFNPLQLSF